MIMNNIIYQNMLVNRGDIYFIRILKKDQEYVLNLSMDVEENIREFPLQDPLIADSENFSAADLFHDIISAEERWIKDNR